MFALELSSLVNTYFEDPNGLPPLQPKIDVTPDNIRTLIYLTFRVFATLFALDIPSEAAGNRFEVLVVLFLDCIDRVGRQLHPTKASPIWLSKYGILGLLRCRQHFIDYTYMHSLYEGGIIGEGMVKELRPLCPNAVRSGWPCNLMNAYNRQNVLDSFTKGFETGATQISTCCDARLDPNYKRYATWEDVRYEMSVPHPISIVMLAYKKVVTCFIVVRMFGKSYKKAIQIDGSQVAFADPTGFLYHTILLDDKETVMDDQQAVASYGLLLPNLWSPTGAVQFCCVDKEWRCLGTENQWMC